MIFDNKGAAGWLLCEKQGGKSGLQQAWWLLTGAGRETWKVPQKSYRFRKHLKQG